ncbi:MAG TPA: hypothetical protein PLH98_05930 [Ruminococcus flavefaciens]|mgnify:FL=1|nr:hypothetical protein [Ruminococcus flavefaciens]
MDKPRSLRILAVAAALVSLLGIMLNTVVVLNPHIAAILLGYGNVKEMMDAKLNSSTVTLMMIQAFIPALMTILCGINIFADKVSKLRSTFTLIAGPAAYIVISIASTIIYTYAIRSAMADGINTVQLISSITSVRSVLAYIHTAAFVLIMCAAAVEHYIGRKENN